MNNTEQPTPRSASTYWAVLKKRLTAEGAGELLTNCKQLKLPAADGKNFRMEAISLSILETHLPDGRNSRREYRLVEILRKTSTSIPLGMLPYNNYKQLNVN